MRAAGRHCWEPDQLRQGRRRAAPAAGASAAAKRGATAAATSAREPIFDGRFDVVSSRVVGGAHLKMVLRPMAGSDPIDAIAFGKLPEDLAGARQARMLYRLDVNHFRGEASAQLRVEHILV